MVFVNGFLTVSAQNQELKQFFIRGFAQGTHYSVTYFGENEILAKTEIDSLFSVIDQSMSLYKKGTLIQEFNEEANDYIVMDVHMQKVLDASFKAYELSKGKFDITVQPLVQQWGFGVHKNMPFPKDEDIQRIRKYVGMDKLEVKGDTLIKKHPEVKIDMDGIAPGYTVDYISSYLKDKGIDNHLVEVGGEVYASGLKNDGTKFRIGVNMPKNEEELIVALSNKAITTSGSYEQYKKHKDEVYTHHIDPSTGYPTKNKIISASIIAGNALYGDALSSICMLLPPKESLALVNRLKDVELFLLYEENNDIHSIQSPGFKNYLATNKNLN